MISSSLPQMANLLGSRAFLIRLRVMAQDSSTSTAASLVNIHIQQDRIVSFHVTSLLIKTTSDNMIMHTKLKH